MSILFSMNVKFQKPWVSFWESPQTFILFRSVSMLSQFSNQLFKPFQPGFRMSCPHLDDAVWRDWRLFRWAIHLWKIVNEATTYYFWLSITLQHLLTDIHPSILVVSSRVARVAENEANVLAFRLSEEYLVHLL